MRNDRLRKGFTIIELIVVIAILGILVLLALPKFLGYTEKAKVSQVKNDIVAYEKVIDTKRIDDDKYIKDWEKVDLVTMGNLKKSLFNKKGLISESNEIAGGEYYKIPEDSKLVKTSLKGDFYLGQGGEVYYYDEKLANKVNGKSEESSQPSEPAPPVKPEHPTDKDLGYSDADFTWVPHANGYNVKNREKGYFKYTGTGRSTVEIPHVIQGVPMTSYYRMFEESPAEVTKVISTNKNVTSMKSMFLDSKATSLDVSELDTSNVKDMSYMFYKSQAESLDLSSFNTSNVTDMDSMFRNSQATSITFGPKFNTSKVTNMSGMFQSSQATSLDLNSFDTSNVTNMSFMFASSQATSLDVSKFNTSNVTNMYAMFYVSQATSLDLRSFNTSKVTIMEDMLRKSQATSITFGPNFNTSKVTNMSGMFDGSQAESLDLSSFDTSNVTDVSWMFSGSKATTVYARTQADAKKFNASSIPPGLKFIVGKP